MISFKSTSFCLLLTVLLTLCNILRAKSLCQFPKYKDKTMNPNIKRIQSLEGKIYTSHDALNQYTFRVGICANLDSEEFPNTAVTQSGGQKGEMNTHSLGSLENVHIIGGNDWVLLHYKDGETYSSVCSLERRSTMVMITCDPNVDNSNAKMVYIEEENSKTESCYYLFEMNHKAVCPVVKDNLSLSIGSILVIVFFSVLAVYLLVGFLYQRFILGSKGWEQIPNYEFWKDFGNLQADGCDLICRSNGRKTTGFRGIGDEQLEPVEEIRDDNMLPM